MLYSKHFCLSTSLFLNYSSFLFLFSIPHPAVVSQKVFVCHCGVCSAVAVALCLKHYSLVISWLACQLTDGFTNIYIIKIHSKTESAALAL